MSLCLNCRTMQPPLASLVAFFQVLPVQHLLIGLAALVCSGCVSTSSGLLPNSYRQACAKVCPQVSISAKSDQLYAQYEGLIAVGVNAGRQVSQAKMIKEAKITPALVCQEVASQIGAQIPPPFQHASAANSQLALKLNITAYGWQVPTGGIAGIRTAPYRFYIAGIVAISDATTGKRLVERPVHSSTSIGNKPTAQDCVYGLKSIAVDFARASAGCLYERE